MFWRRGSGILSTVQPIAASRPWAGIASGLRGLRGAAALPGAAIATLSLPFGALPALAEDGGLASHQIVLTASMVGVVAVAAASAIGMMRQRARADETIARLRLENADLKAEADRAEALIDVEDQLTLCWDKAGEPPLLVGALGADAGAPKARAEFLAFGTWLEPESARELDHRIGALRERGAVFQLELATRSGSYVEAQGGVAGGRPFVRFRDLTTERVAFADLKARHRRLENALGVMRALFEAMPSPAWLRDEAGQLIWVNGAYARAVDAEDEGAVAAAQTELLDKAGRETIARQRSATPTVSTRLPVVVAGQRRTYDVIDVAADHGQAGLAIDVTDLEQTQAELRRTIEFHARTLDQLATAVAIFGPDKRLQFYNAAYRGLFGIDAAFLEQSPEDGAVLDQLRALRRLPEQADWRLWKREMLAAYTSIEAREHWWHLPGGQTLRVIANPHPQGGVTYVYENVTERLELEKRHNALVRVQGETLDHLSEGVVVFGSDGRLRLCNPAFQSMWRIDPAAVSERTHIAEMIRLCEASHPDAATWNALKLTVTGLADNRTRIAGRMERPDGLVIEYTAVPLPDGATLITFVNVTDTVNVERALMERNEALQEADNIKTDFVGLVSYELRSPLTNIIGFAHLLADPRTGELNPKQQDYAGHIMTSSQSLMAIVDDILDLATIDAGIMQLQLSDVDIATTVDAAVRGLEDRISGAHLRILTDVPADVGKFTADEKRVRQILFNLLSNAIRFSKDGGTVTIAARREADRVLLMVIDEGVGIPQDQLKSVFDRFYARRQGPNRGGAGLGLSIVKSFVEVHGGSVTIESTEGLGTTVICRFPARPAEPELALPGATAPDASRMARRLN